MTMNESLQRIINDLQPRERASAQSPRSVRQHSLSAAIDSLSFATPTASKRTDYAMIALKAALHLFNDDLDRSHRYSQQIEDDATGSYWHGIMHRMEGDYSNSNYWFRQAGEHPAMRKLAEQAREWLRSPAGSPDRLAPGAIRDALIDIRDSAGWNAPLLTGAVARQEGGEGTDESRALLEHIQHIEMRELLEHTLEAAGQTP